MVEQRPYVDVNVFEAPPRESSPYCEDPCVCCAAPLPPRKPLLATVLRKQGAFDERFGCLVRGVALNAGPALGAFAARALLVAGRRKRLAVTRATTSTMDFAASWGLGLDAAGCPEFIVAVDDEQAAETLSATLGADRVFLTEAPAASLARAALRNGLDVRGSARM